MKKGYINTVMLSCLAARRVSASQQLNKAEALNKDTFRATRRVGFTLVELLVVVLIIGVLSAIAIPMYQGAVDKSHWSTMLPGAKAIKDAEEAIKMTNGTYTDEMANLDVTMNNSDLTFALVTPNNTADPNVIRVTNSKLANVRLASYLNDSPMFAGQLHCEAKTGDERAERLCGKLLMGQELTSIDGYVGYLLDQEIDQASCDNASRSWSTSKTKCYKTTADRCTALGMGVVAGMDEQCGYENKDKTVIGAEGICVGNGPGNMYVWNKCRQVTVQNGGTCRGDSVYACAGSTIENGGVCDAFGIGACAGVTVNEGGKCIGHGGQDQCYQSTINAGIVDCRDTTGYCGWISSFDNGAICVGSYTSAAPCYGASFKNGSICYGKCAGYDGKSASFDATSCCCGSACHPNAPKCDPSRCDPQYMK